MKTRHLIEVNGPVPEELLHRLEAGEISPEDFFSEVRGLGISFYFSKRTLEAEPGDGIKISKAHLDYEGL
jgi:hypothetical protein